VAWVFFRAESIGEAWVYLGRLASFNPGEFVGLAAAPHLVAAVLLHNHVEPRLEAIARWSAQISPLWLAAISVAAFTLLVLASFFIGDHRAFIYFQF